MKDSRDQHCSVLGSFTPLPSVHADLLRNCCIAVLPSYGCRFLTLPLPSCFTIWKEHFLPLPL